MTLKEEIQKQLSEPIVHEPPSMEVRIRVKRIERLLLLIAEELSEEQSNQEGE